MSRTIDDYREMAKCYCFDFQEAKNESEQNEILGNLLGEDAEVLACLLRTSTLLTEDD